ncbi:hypothetical protein F511_41974 [Dorcoceras hygrometricum]|uniref:Uncharacterized protein n=1 Tax=Dorcoceras hygrometricum TaxID=472368 RepID=A0A2Z7AWN6_9LAMI|nr:hypothetical protein F511_41974 [Dorcoceras hygrometricum]
MRRRLERHVNVRGYCSSDLGNLSIIIKDFDRSLPVVSRYLEDISSHSDLSKSGSVGLLLLTRFILYLFRRFAISWKKFVKEATLCSLLPIEQICFSVQVSDLCARDLVVVIIAQKVKVRM